MSIADWLSELQKRAAKAPPLHPVLQAVVGSASSLVVLVPHGAELYNSGPSGTWPINFTMLCLVWLLSVCVLVYGRETDIWGLIMKGIGLPSALFALAQVG